MRAFEAAARHCNFTLAATELHVTQAAVSHQVKQLEEWLGCKLFERFGHALTLTVKGRDYLAALTPALDALALASERLSETSLAGSLRVSVLPSFASKWLLPRLGAFSKAHPEIDLHVRSAVGLEDFATGKCEVGIRLGLGRWPGLQADLIARERLSPVCSPQIDAGKPPLRTPADLCGHALLHDQPRDHWSRWLQMAGVVEADVRYGPAFSDSAMVLQAAMDGHGVALGRLFLAADDLAAGRLLQPFVHELDNDFSYWLVSPKALASTPRVAAFRTWVLREASGDSPSAQALGQERIAGVLLGQPGT
jgi:LysR family glycine cleavage system transcriptional activator